MIVRGEGQQLAFWRNRADEVFQELMVEKRAHAATKARPANILTGGAAIRHAELYGAQLFNLGTPVSGEEAKGLVGDQIWCESFD